MSDKEVPVDQNADLINAERIELSPGSSEPEIKPEDVATLSLNYRDGTPVITVSGGDALPAGIAVETANGQIVAIYKAETQYTTQTRAFPPVNQLYTLHEPVKLYPQGGSEADGTAPVGGLSGFDIIVNQSG